MRLLLLDTCGPTGSLALAEDDTVRSERMLAPQTASAQLVGAIRQELEGLGWSLRTVDVVAVVTGPGSFTGVRVGLAAAKGICEVAKIQLAALSRLEVLLAAGQAQVPDAAALAVLDAGRGEFYVRVAGDEEELLLGRDDLVAAALERRVVVAEDQLLASVQELQPVLVPLTAAQALAPARQRAMRGGDAVDIADANYVRQGHSLYAAGARHTLSQKLSTDAA